MAASAKRRLTFFFDFISPFSYFAHARLQLPSSHPRAFFSEGLERMEVEYRPVLLAGILKHWGQLGPAEIANKRRFTYEHSYWLGRRQEGMADFVFPSAHPFNSLPLLRTALACHNDPQAITRIFRFVWAEGHIPDASPQFRALLQELGLQTSDISSVHVKEALRRNTEEAIGSGVFGVPSLLVSGDGQQQAPRVFWGNDSLGFAREWLMRQQEEEGGGFFGEPSFTRLADLPLAATRVPIKGATATGGQQ